MFRSHAASFLVVAFAGCGLACSRPASLRGSPSASAAARPPSPPTAPASQPASLASAVAPDTASPSVAVEEGARTCPSLPVARPADLVIGVSRHIVPHGEEITVHRAELSESQGACRANLALGAASTYACIQVTPAELDELWRAFRKRSFTSMTSSAPSSLSPHYGARFVWLRWGGRYACEVGDSTQARIDAAHDKGFFELLYAVEDTGRKHL
jgi:hypothetical protein